MTDSEGNTEVAPSEVSGARHGRHPRSLANLRPAWRSGVSGNPSGLTKDGRAPKAAKLEAALLDELEKSGGMSALAKKWVLLAKRGNSTALSAILDRLYPVPDDDKGQGRVILEGLKLELTPSGATVTSMRQELPAGGGSDAQTSSSESRAGGRDTLNTPTLGPIEQGILPSLGTSSIQKSVPLSDAQAPEGSGEGVLGVSGGAGSSGAVVLPGLHEPVGQEDGGGAAG